MKKMFIDLETTGTDPRRHGIIQISGCFDQEGTDRKLFSMDVRPFDSDEVEESALVANGKTALEISSYDPAESVFVKFISSLDRYIDKFDRNDKFQFIAYNSPFDDSFLRVFFDKCIEKTAIKSFYGSYFSWPDMCVARMAANQIGPDRNKLENFKLATACQHFGIVVDDSKLHDATYDVDLTIKLYDLLSKQ